MSVTTGVTTVHLDDCERTGNWSLVRRSLDLQSFGMNVVTIPQGEQIPEHDETDRDQEEVFLALAGNPTLVVDGEGQPLAEGTFARLDPAVRRTVRNDASRPATVLIASAPRSSGYEPMGWA
jgi:quercetin dioxygenase-like cupin family protein